MINKFATFISYLFHPLFVFFYVFLFLLFQSDLLIGILFRYRIYLIIAYLLGNSIIIPLILIYFFQRDFFLENRRQRTIPYLIVIVAYIFVFIFLQRYPLPEIIMKFLLSLIIGLSILTLLNLFKKISLHTCAAGATLAIFLELTIATSHDFFIPLIFIFIFNGLIGTSRLLLKKHTPFEIYTGYLLGIATTFLVIEI